MKLTLNETEIKAALTQYVLGTVSLANVDRDTLEIDFTNTRGTDGLTATIDIPYVGVRSLDLDVRKSAKTPAAEGKGSDTTKAVETTAAEPTAETEAAPAAAEEAAPAAASKTNLFGSNS